MLRQTLAITSLALGFGLGCHSSEVAPPATTSERVPLAQYRGEVNVERGTFELHRITSRAVSEVPVDTDNTVDEGPPGTVELQTTNVGVGAAGCGRVSSFCGDVTVLSHFNDEELRGLYVTIDSISSTDNVTFGASSKPAYADSSTTDNFGLWIYGNYDPFTNLQTRTWKFGNPSGASFTFQASVWADVVPVGTDSEFECDNSADEDSDGLVDCGDPDCGDEPVCLGFEEICGNGIDDNFNGAHDCGEESCAADPNFCTLSEKKVFVTSATYDGAFDDSDGLGAADAECAQLATAASLTGSYKAWLSGQSDPFLGGDLSASARLNQNFLAYELVNGTKVADNWDDLTDGSLDAPINVDENGTTVAASNVWTGTTAGGDAAASPFGGPEAPDSCGTWTTTTGSAIFGSTTATSSAWSETMTSAACSQMNRLYCFEQ